MATIAERGQLLWLLYFAAVRRITRMGSMQPELSWPFEGEVFPQGLLAIIQRSVSAGEFPALTVIHDDEDDWLVSDGVHDPNGGASSVLHLQHVVDSDPSLAQLATMPPGYVARRSTAADTWVIEEWTYPDD
ncbi:hypothetical protein OG585_51580 (plasmid) [Streptomyces sp. NBC_01340]|uniref:hypothetical protein n=2 Tax=unclassified Streptomyces TaxID=2593676 RepID=UPI002259B3A5|nr:MULTISPECIES: hypothetical protein [unclassified Streptomyces]MCX4460442.1 hypothetical protein [Streptomyces sp. NBC_01719]MCX4500228.1 hypothetical protein [Streptomyces sp. NBC_01728]WSI45295.1 hypothetical protein OG585_51580 [Streptomyces sp. NBC_01340]